MAVYNNLPAGAGGGEFVELAHMTAVDTTYTLSHDVSDYKYIVAVSYYGNFTLNSVTIPTVLWQANKFLIVNFNDTTLRKAQMQIVDNTHVKTTSTWNNITGVYLYGVK